MADKFTQEQRSQIMASVHSSNTSPEIRVRKLLHRLGYRFRLHRKDLPGKPDIVLPKYNAVIFVNGCFWHGCPICLHAQIRPKANADYWNKKLDRNMQRDQENYITLENRGWKVLVIWEHEVKKKNLPDLMNRLLVELPQEKTASQS